MPATIQRPFLATIQRPFLATGPAAEMLIFAGFQVSLRAVGQTKALFAGGQQVACGYRDGTNWKFKTETIQEFIDCNSINVDFE